MTTTLYDLSVGCYLQTLTAVSGFLAKGREHFEAAGVDLEDIADTRLFNDMLPFRFQIVSVQHHSLHAVQGLERGVFGPPGAVGDMSYTGLQTMISDSIKELEAMAPDAVNAHSGKDMTFKMGEMAIPFRAETFIMSFSLPNFHFHATTAYDILRMKGVPLGKRNYLGPMRMKV